MDGFRNPSSTFTGSETAANLNSGNAKTVTVTAKWKSNCTENCSDVSLSVNESIGYSYTGTVKGVTLKKAGKYKLEVWGAQGGRGNILSTTTYGGYAYGTYSANGNSVIYIVIGRVGPDGQNSSASQGHGENISGAYNGGGSIKKTVSGLTSNGNGGGGGATHIATRTGLLSTLSSYKSSVLIVAGGGGGSGNMSTALHNGGSGGGQIGGQGDNGNNSSYLGGIGGSQSSGGAYREYGSCSCCGSEGTGGSFGQGGNNYFSGASCEASSGGGGWYGGAAGNVAGTGGGGGSGYIGNSLLLGTKRMYQYSTGCTSSTATATYTVCTSSTGHAVANAANTGDGYARITYLGT